MEEKENNKNPNEGTDTTNNNPINQGKEEAAKIIKKMDSLKDQIRELEKKEKEEKEKLERGEINIPTIIDSNKVFNEIRENNLKETQKESLLTKSCNSCKCFIF